MNPFQMAMLFEEWNQWMDPVNQLSATLAEAFKKINDISDEDWEQFITYTEKQCKG